MPDCQRSRVAEGIDILEFVVVEPALGDIGVIIGVVLARGGIEKPRDEGVVELLIRAAPGRAPVEVEAEVIDLQGRLP